MVFSQPAPVAKRKKPKRADNEQRSIFRPARLLAKTNRGLLLDIFVFVANIFLLHLLTKIFIDLVRLAEQDEPLAKLALGLTCLGMWCLPVAGAVLKRWHFHQRLKEEGKAVAGSETRFAGCLFNPIFYFCMNLVLTSAVLAALGEIVFGKRLLASGGLFVSLTIAGLVLTIFQTFLIYRYFWPPKKPPQTEFLRAPQSETVGDICLFLNMLLFQVAWNLVTFAPLQRVSGVADFVGRLFFLSFVALLIYFPPRMFYLAEDINRPRTWLTMLLANSPVILRTLIGNNEWS